MRGSYSIKPETCKMLLILIPCLTLCLFIALSLVFCDESLKPLNLPAPTGWQSTSQAKINKDNSALLAFNWEVPEACPVELYKITRISSGSFNEAIEIFEIPASAVSKENNDFVYFTIFKPEDGLPDNNSREEAERYVAALPELDKKYSWKDPEGYDQKEYERQLGITTHIDYGVPEFSVEPMNCGGYAVRGRCTLVVEEDGGSTTRQLGNQLMIFKDNHVYIILALVFTTEDHLLDDQLIIDYIKDNLSFN